MTMSQAPTWVIWLTLQCTHMSTTTGRRHYRTPHTTQKWVCPFLLTASILSTTSLSLCFSSSSPLFLASVHLFFSIFISLKRISCLWTKPERALGSLLTPVYQSLIELLLLTSGPHGCFCSEHGGYAIKIKTSLKWSLVPQLNHGPCHNKQQSIRGHENNLVTRAEGLFKNEQIWSEWSNGILITFCYKYRNSRH